MSFFDNIFQDIESKFKEAFNEISPILPPKLDSKSVNLAFSSTSQKFSDLHEPLNLSISNKTIKEENKLEEFENKLGVICKDCGRRTGPYIERHSCESNNRKSTMLQRFSVIPVLCKDCLQVISGLPNTHKCGKTTDKVHEEEFGLKCSDCLQIILGDPIQHKCQNTINNLNEKKPNPNFQPKLRNKVLNRTNSGSMWTQILEKAEVLKDIFEPEKTEPLTISQAIEKNFKQVNKEVPENLKDLSIIPEHYLFRPILVPGTLDKLNEDLENNMKIENEQVALIDEAAINKKRITFMLDHFEIRDLDDPNKVIKIPINDKKSTDKSTLEKRRSRGISGFNSIFMDTNMNFTKS